MFICYAQVKSFTVNSFDTRIVVTVGPGVLPLGGLEMTDQNFLNLAQQYGFKDGASALIAVVMCPGCGV